MSIHPAAVATAHETVPLLARTRTVPGLVRELHELQRLVREGALLPSGGELADRFHSLMAITTGTLARLDAHVKVLGGATPDAAESEGSALPPAPPPGKLPHNFLYGARTSVKDMIGKFERRARDLECHVAAHSPILESEDAGGARVAALFDALLLEIARSHRDNALIARDLFRVIDAELEKRGISDDEAKRNGRVT